MESHEHYDRQHQDLRTENGVFYGDTIDFVDFKHAAALTAVNVVTLASWLGAAGPDGCKDWRRRGARYLAQLDGRGGPRLAGYKLLWRETDARNGPTRVGSARWITSPWKAW